MTMPWSDTGLRLLPTAQYFKYHQAMTDIQNEYNRLVDVLSGCEWEITQASAKLGDLFQRDEYPTVEALRNKFGFRLSYIPLPDAGDFRIDIGNEATEQVKEHYQSYYSAQLNNAMNDVWQRTHKALSAVSERLDYSASEDKKIFRDTLVTNVLDMVELLTVCNVTGDSQMEAARLKLRMHCAVSTRTLCVRMLTYGQRPSVPLTRSSNRFLHSTSNPYEFVTFHQENYHECNNSNVCTGS